MCHSNDFYMFSDINRGVPEKGNCREELSDFVISYGRPIYIIGFSIFGFLFFNVMMACCMCCHPKREHKDHKEFYNQLNNNYYG